MDFVVQVSEAAERQLLRYCDEEEDEDVLGGGQVSSSPALPLVRVC